MGHKKSKSGFARVSPSVMRSLRVSLPRVRPPSPQQTHATEFRRTIKDCSTAELDYRLNVNNDQMAVVKLDGIEAQAKLNISRQMVSKLTREHDVLTAEIEGR